MCFIKSISIMHLLPKQAVWASTSTTASRLGTYLATIEMGDPRTPDCQHFGICRVNLWSGESSPPCDCRIASWINVETEGVIRLGFIRATLTDKVYRMHFHNGKLVLPADCRVSAEVTEKLFGEIHNMILRAGVYPIYKCPGLLEVYIKTDTLQMPPG